MRKIAFIGPMGSGKSTLALRYAQSFGGQVIDTDGEFTARYGDISRFIDEHGEKAFRQAESEIVIDAASSNATIISCGGGAVLSKRNMSALRRNCDIVYLTAPIDILKKRIESSDRPFKNYLEKTINEREKLYRRYADYTIDTSGGDCVQKLSKALARPRNNRYDILLCDADDTVLDFKKAMCTSVVNAARQVGVKAPDQKIIAEFSDITVFVWRKLENEGLLRDELDKLRFAMLKERLNENFDASAMSAAFMAEMKRTRFVIDGAIEFLDDVRARGIKVYIITNGFAFIARERLKAVISHTDGVFISDEIGYNKPDARFFDYVLKALDVTDKSRVLVFGDGVNSDIRGGINSGLDTCLFDPSGGAVSEADYAVKGYDEIFNIL
ncbi:MAG: HAD-IA family hydrolase [Clostridiales bacterium]|nr:HAD-IA family hydrolase [Clostridiales bacterium]